MAPSSTSPLRQNKLRRTFFATGCKIDHIVLLLLQAVTKTFSDCRKQRHNEEFHDLGRTINDHF